MPKYIHDWRAKEFVDYITDKTAINMKSVCELVTDGMKSRIPIDSGLTAKGIGYQVIKKQGVIEGVVGVTKKSKRSYIAWFLEWGTIFMPAKPFMRRSISAVGAKIVKIINGT